MRVFLLDSDHSDSEGKLWAWGLGFRVEGLHRGEGYQISGGVCRVPSSMQQRVFRAR